MCELLRVGELGKSIIEDDNPPETELRMTEPRYFTKNMKTFYCKENRHIRFQCPKLGEENATKCKYLECIIGGTHS